MTRLVSITKSGPKFHEPRSLESLLADSVSFEREKWLQLNCVPSAEIQAEYARTLVHLELDRVVSRG